MERQKLRNQGALLRQDHSSKWVSYISLMIDHLSFALIDLFVSELCLEATSTTGLLELASSIHVIH